MDKLALPVIALCSLLITISQVASAQDEEARPRVRAGVQMGPVVGASARIPIAGAVEVQVALLPSFVVDPAETTYAGARVLVALQRGRFFDNYVTGGVAVLFGRSRKLDPVTFGVEEEAWSNRIYFVSLATDYKMAKRFVISADLGLGYRQGYMPTSPFGGDDARRLLLALGIGFHVVL
jgi:hypothetical protein